MCTLKGTEVSLSYVQCFFILYLLQCLFFILYGWIPSGQTSYTILVGYVDGENYACVGEPGYMGNLSFAMNLKRP